jgi:hypothetical protein
MNTKVNFIVQDKKYKVKVHIKDRSGEWSYMYWALSGATLDEDKAYVFTDATMPDFYKQSLEQPYVEREYVGY